MEKTLNDQDIDAIATRVVEMLGAKLSSSARPPQPKAVPSTPATETPKQSPQKLAFTLEELSRELGISKVSLYRLEARGLLKALPYLRRKIFSRQEVEKFLSGHGGEITRRRA